MHMTTDQEKHTDLAQSDTPAVEVLITKTLLLTYLQHLYNIAKVTLIWQLLRTKIRLNKNNIMLCLWEAACNAQNWEICDPMSDSA